MATTFTHVQQVPISIELKDGFGHDLPFEDAIFSTDDATVAIVDGGFLRGIAPSPEGVTNRLTATVDAEMGDGVQIVTAMAEFIVVLDERAGARILNIVLGPAVDQAV